MFVGVLKFDLYARLRSPILTRIIFISNAPVVQLIRAFASHAVDTVSNDIIYVDISGQDITVHKPRAQQLV